MRKIKQILSIILTLCLIFTIFPIEVLAEEGEDSEIASTAQVAKPNKSYEPVHTITPEHCHPVGIVPYDDNDDGEPYLYIGIEGMSSGSEGKVISLLDYSEYPLFAKYVDEKRICHDVGKDYNCCWYLNSNNIELLADAQTLQPHIRTLSKTGVVEITASYTLPDGTILTSVNPCRVQVQQLKLGSNKSILQYAALSYVVYTEFGTGSFSNLTIDSLLDGNTLYESEKYISAKLNSNARFINFYSATISGWSVKHARKLGNGLYAALFQSPDGKNVLAFRGTEPEEGSDIITDICLGTGNDASQLHSALDYYDDLRSWGYSNITLTGHSLGGGLANYVSVLRGVKAYTFNAPSTMVSAIRGNTVEFARNFTGLNDDFRIDYVNPEDWIGNTGIGDNPVSTFTKNIIQFTVHQKLELGGKIDKTTFVMDQSGKNGKGIFLLAPYHFFQQLLAYNPTNNIISIQQTGKETNPKSYQFDNFGVFFIGSTGQDSVFLKNSGNDYIFTGSGNDIIILDNGSRKKSMYNSVCAGLGNDSIIGSPVTDEYYLYCKGDGYDEIYDLGGNDTICLYGYQDSEISVRQNGTGIDGKYIADIYAGSNLIIKIHIRGRGSYIIKNETTGNTIETINRYIPSVISSYSAHCPVDMQICDPDGIIVCELKDGIEMEEHFSFGDFSVIEQDGTYIKNASIFEDGYTVKLVGVGTGTMYYTNMIMENDVPVIRTVENVPVEDGVVYTAMSNADDNTVLKGDDAHKDIVFYVPESVNINMEQATLHYMETINLNASISPVNAVQNVYWSSSNTDVAVVDDNGTVTAVGAGSAVITAKSSFNEEISDSCAITVSDTLISLETAVVSGIEASYPYTGCVIEPELAVTFEELNLVEGIDFKVSYENNMEIGTAMLTIKGIGHFTGTLSESFEIRPLTVDEKVQQLVEECLASGAETDRDKALWLHDWLIYNADYDHNYTQWVSYMPEGVLLNGLGVCQSYASAYSLLLTAMGIENVMVSSEIMDHAWNIAKIDGVYTHIDCTWDDPNSGGLENHYYFGLGDEEMQDHIWDQTKYPQCQKLKTEIKEEALPDPYVLFESVEGIDYTLIDVNGNVIKREDIERKGGNTLLVLGRSSCPNTMVFLNKLSDWIPVLKQHNVNVFAVMENSDQVKEISSKFSFPCTYAADYGYEGLQFNTRIGLFTDYMYPQVVLQNSQGYSYYYSTGYVYEPEKIVSTAIQTLPQTEQVDYSPVHFYTNEKEMKDLIQDALANKCRLIKLCNLKIPSISEDVITETIDLIYEMGLPYGGYCSSYWPINNLLIFELEYKEESKGKGDVDNSGKVDVNDALIVLKIAASLITPTEEQRRAADVNGDGKVDSGDALLILKYAAGLITEL